MRGAAAAPSTGARAAPELVRVWDPFVRVAHWSLAASVLLCHFVLEEGDPPHEWVGTFAAALVLLRIVWGFVGTRHARFADFWPTPTRLRAHLRHLLSGRPDTHLGHNPLGAVVMLAMMALVLALAASGWLMSTDAFFGAEWLQDVHEMLADTLIGLVALHVLAAVVMSGIERTNLIRSMITGTKPRHVDHVNIDAQ